MEALLSQTIQPTVPSLKLHRKRTRRTKVALMNKLQSLIQGERDIVKIFSNALSSEICFYNPALITVENLPENIPAYTTREISFVLSLSPEELRRYHYLKTRLI